MLLEYGNCAGDLTKESSPVFILPSTIINNAAKGACTAAADKCTTLWGLNHNANSPTLEFRVAVWSNSHGQIHTADKVLVTDGINITSSFILKRFMCYYAFSVRNLYTGLFFFFFLQRLT